jgi:hypothetical protein
MLRKTIAAVTLTIVVPTALSLRAADAAKRQSRPQSGAAVSTEAPSLDGRVLGYPRTCGSNTFIYGPQGGPIGPYCH